MTRYNFFEQFKFNLGFGTGFGLGAGIADFVGQRFLGVRGTIFGGCFGLPIYQDNLNWFNPSMQLFNFGTPMFNYTAMPVNTGGASIWGGVQTPSMPVGDYVSFSGYDTQMNSFGTAPAVPATQFTPTFTPTFVPSSNASSGYVPRVIGSNKTTTAGSRSLSNLSSPDVSNNTVTDLQWWIDQGYNEEKGLAFAKIAKEVSTQKRNAGVTSNCGGGVRESVNKSFYKGENHYTNGWNANQVGDKFLVNDGNFKRIKIPEGMQLEPTDVPAGVIIIYGAGYSDSDAGKLYGHIEVSGGNGFGYSDLTTHLLSNHGNRKEPKEIWIPV